MIKVWETDTLGSVADITMGQSPESYRHNTEEFGLPFLQGCAEFDIRYPNPEIYCFPPLRVAKKGSVLISVRAPVGKMNWCDQDYCIGRGLGSIKAKLNVANTFFLKHVLDQNIRFLHRRSQGSTFLAISLNDLKLFPIPDIPKEIQEKIATIIHCVDMTIENTEALIHKYQQIKAGLMQDLFTRGVTADGKLRPPREQAPELYKESPIGWIPKEWDCVPVSDLCAQVVDCPHSTPIYEKSGIPCIRTADMKPGQLLIEKAFRVSKVTYLNRVQRLTPKQDDVIYSREGERLGIASPVGEQRVCLGQRVMLLRPEQNIDPDFLLWSLNIPDFYRRVIRGLGATTSPHVNVGDIKKILTYLPPEEEQIFIGSFIKKNHSKILREEQHREKLISQKSGIMHDLLTREVQVKVNQEELAHV